MSRFPTVIAMVATLAGCSPQETTAPEEAASPAAEIAAAAGDLPQACRAYLQKAEACFAEAGGDIAASSRQSVDQLIANIEYMRAQGESEESIAMTCTNLSRMMDQAEPRQAVGC